MSKKPKQRGPILLQIRQEDGWIRAYIKMEGSRREFAAISLELVEADDRVLFNEWRAFLEAFIVRKTAEVTGVPFADISMHTESPSERILEN